MNPSAADLLVVRALATVGERGLSLAGLHAAVAVEPGSDALQTFVTDISASLVRLLMSGAVDVGREGGLLVYRLREGATAENAVA